VLGHQLLETTAIFGNREPNSRAAKIPIRCYFLEALMREIKTYSKRGAFHGRLQWPGRIRPPRRSELDM